LAEAEARQTSGGALTDGRRLNRSITLSGIGEISCDHQGNSRIHCAITTSVKTSPSRRQDFPLARSSAPPITWCKTTFVARLFANEPHNPAIGVAIAPGRAWAIEARRGQVIPFFQIVIGEQ